MSKIKICGLYRKEDIEYANEVRPDYIGFIINFPKSHRNLSPEDAKALKEKLDENIKAVGVFVDQSIEYVSEAAEIIGLDVIQLHGHEDEEYIKTLRDKTDRMIWKAFKVRSEEDLKKAENSSADEILLDNGYGTGETFDWDLINDFKRLFILAGGLTPGNIKEAVGKYDPNIVDISSGVETDKVKDKSKMQAAVDAVRGGVL